MPIITLEEHFVAKAAMAASPAAQAHYSSFPPHLMHKLQDLGTARITDLDSGNISLQVVSHGPGDFDSASCTKINDELAISIAKNPSRLAGFATLPMNDPEAAASELKRCIQKLAFVGALIENHLDGTFYDGERFWPVFATAQKLDVPIYIHPTFASDEMEQHYQGNYPNEVGKALSAFGWGWHAETGHHILRLFAAGLFDRFPKLKIIIGHMGEMLPFQLERCILSSSRWGERRRGLDQVWKENIWVTTSGMFSVSSLRCLLDTIPIEHVLYSVDYPFSTNEKGYEFLQRIEDSGLITGERLAQFTYRNAESLLHVRAASSSAHTSRQNV